MSAVPADRWRALGEFIRSRRVAAQRSIRDVARVSGISNPYLSQIERGIRRPSAEILQQIARGLEVSAETLYERAGLLDRPVPGAGRDAVEAAILAEDRLDEAQKAEIIALYRHHAGEGTTGLKP